MIAIIKRNKLILKRAEELEDFNDDQVQEHTHLNDYEDKWRELDGNKPKQTIDPDRRLKTGREQ